MKVYAGSRGARKLLARRSHRRRNGVCEVCRALPGRDLGRQAILCKLNQRRSFMVSAEATMDLLGLSGTHQVKATEIKDGKIWMRDTLRQLQSD